MIPVSKYIRIEMIKKDVKGAEIARRIGVNRSAISKTIDGKIKSYRLRKAIAEALGVPYEELWGEEDK